MSRLFIAIVAFLALVLLTSAQTPVPTDCNADHVNVFEDVGGSQGPSMSDFETRFATLIYNETTNRVFTVTTAFLQAVLENGSGANYTFQVNNGPVSDPNVWPNDDAILVDGFLTGCNVTNVITLHTFQRADPNVFRDENCSYFYIINLVSPNTCCNGPAICGDPQFKGLRGQSFQVHGIDGAVYNLISTNSFSVNSQFRFLTGPRACPIIPSTGRRSIACWSHEGSYLGNFAVSTANGEKILLESGSSSEGFASVTVDGKALSLNEVVTFSQGSIVLNSTHEVTLKVGPFDIEIENNNEFLNLRSVRVPASEWHLLSENGGTHGLLGQTWQNKRYSGKVKEIQGDVDDYVIENDDIFAHDFVYSRFVATQ